MSWRVIGFKKQKDLFESLIEQGPLSHAYIFQGPEQIGKKLFAQDVFVKANQKKEFNSVDPDLLVIGPRLAEDETKIYIEDIRDLKTFLSLRSYYESYRFVIIDDAHRLTTEASNALLKLLEEPVAKVIFILVTSQPQELLQTISSRAQHVNFLPHVDKVVEEAISNSKLSKPDQALAVALAHGRIGWAINAMQTGVFRDIKQSVEEFSEILKSPLAERMTFAKRLFEKQPYQEEVNYWLAWAYANRSTLHNAHHVLSQLLVLHQYINQPQYNHRALLENTLINL